MHWEPRTDLAKAVVAAGFRYDPQQDILYSKLDAWQRRAGFTWAYDIASPCMHMIIDAEPIYFSYRGRMWMIELWKGQYGLESGGEIGVYRDDAAGASSPMNPRARFYGSATPAEQLTMSFTLYRNRSVLLHRGPESHWWLTGFRWGVFTPHTTDIVMDLNITFPTTEMRDAFKGAVQKLKYNTSERDRYSLGFKFDTPRTPQPPQRGRLEAKEQAHNEKLVAGYNALKKALGISSNDPNGFPQPHGPVHKAGQNISRVAKKIEQHAAPLAKKIAGSAAGQKIQHAAAAVAGAVQAEFSDEAVAAYTEIATFFDEKVWHCTNRGC